MFPSFFPVTSALVARGKSLCSVVIMLPHCRLKFFSPSCCHYMISPHLLKIPFSPDFNFSHFLLHASWFSNSKVMTSNAWQISPLSCLILPYTSVKIFHGVAKSQTRQSDFTFTFHFHALEKEMATHSSVLAWRILHLSTPDRQTYLHWASYFLPFLLVNRRMLVSEASFSLLFPPHRLL